jgi:hypothetical protein
VHRDISCGVTSASTLGQTQVDKKGQVLFRIFKKDETRRHKSTTVKRGSKAAPAVFGGIFMHAVRLCSWQLKSDLVKQLPQVFSRGRETWQDPRTAFFDPWVGLNRRLQFSLRSQELLPFFLLSLDGNSSKDVGGIDWKLHRHRSPGNGHRTLVA